MIEDFTTYTEVDQYGDITVTSSKCDISTMQRQATSYVGTTKPVDHFADFQHHLTVYCSACDETGNLAFWALGNGADTLHEMNEANCGLTVQLYRGTGAETPRLSAYDYNTGNLDYYVIAFNTIYYLTIQRIGSTFTVKFYSDAARTTLLDTITITCATTKYRYVYAVCGRDDQNPLTEAASGYCESLDLLEARRSWGFITG